jgi:zinc transporter
MRVAVRNPVTAAARSRKLVVMGPDQISHPRLLPDIFVIRMDGAGGAEAMTPEAFAELRPSGDGAGFAWLHMARDHPNLEGYLAACGIDRFVREALTADETRPRCTVHGNGVLLNLRGVNLNPGAEPEDMVSVRFWIEAHRIVGLWVRPLVAVADLKAAAERGQAPVSPGDLVAKLALRLADRAEPVVAVLNEKIDTLEEQVLDAEGGISREELSGVRRSAILLRRYLLPQRDALTTL